MSNRFTLSEMMAVTGGRLLQGSAATPVTGFAYDSRKVAPGDCFVAMPGERVDGHDYTAKAAAAGAAIILAARPVEAPGAAVLQVEDPLLALGQLGRYHRERFAIPLVGITGSIGKTTTKELVAAALSRRFAVLRSAGNLNSEVGLPIALMELGAEHQVAVLEMGMRALGEIAYLTAIAKPQIGIVTNVGPTHLELLGTIDNIALAKSELVRTLPPDGAAILNQDDHLVAAMAEVSPCKVWAYGFTAEGVGDRWVTAREPKREGEVGQRFRLVTSVGEAEAYLPAPGRHSLLNAMAAVAAGLELGMSLAEVIEGLAGYQPSGGRLRVIHAGGVRLLDDTYNAAPASVIANLGIMREMAGSGRCFAVLSEMRELGSAAEQGHDQVGEAAGRLADALVAVGGDFARRMVAAAGAGARHVATKAEALALLKQELRPGDTLLVKGARSMAMEEIVQALTNHLGE